MAISLATGEVMAKVISVFALSVAFSTWHCWACTCTRRRLGAAQTGQGRLGAALAAQAGSVSGAAVAAREWLRMNREPQARPAALAEIAEGALAGQAGRTAILNQDTEKALQQQRRDLHVKIGGNKEEVVRRLTAHMIGRDYVQLPASGVTG